jgi:hypothetical protein
MRERSKYIRIRWDTWKELRTIFKAKPNESVADYIERLMNHTIVQGEAYNQYEVAKK